MRHCHATANPIIDYDAIMKSIKIDNTLPPPVISSNISNKSKQRVEKYAENLKMIHDEKQKRKHEESQTKGNIKHVQPKYSQILPPNWNIQKNSANSMITRPNKNYIYSSIVQDDLSKQSCFQSVYRQPLTYQLSTENKKDNSDAVQFQLYFAGNEKSESKRQNYGNKSNIRTPSKFKKWKTLAEQQMQNQNLQKSKQKQLTFDYDKQNNRNGHNQSCNEKQINLTNQQNNKLSHNIEKQHRYLSHTETSGHKVKARKPQLGNSKNFDKNRTSPINRPHKTGIQVILQKCYQKL